MKYKWRGSPKTSNTSRAHRRPAADIKLHTREAAGLRLAELAQTVPISPEAARKPFWQKPVARQTAILLALGGWLYAPILLRLIAQWWSDPNFSHGFFVPLFSSWVVWQNRRRLQAIRPAPSLWGLPVVCLSLSALLFGVLGSEIFVARMSLLVLTAGIILFFLGWRMLRAVAFPLAFLVLMVPIPAIIFNQITFPLQILASKLAAAVLPLFGVPVLREGNIINLPAMPLEVAEACSGVRSLLSLATLAVIYGYVLEKAAAMRILLALAALPIAVAANGLRIVGTGLLVQYWDPLKAEGFFHVFSGWLIFVFSLLMLFVVHRFLAFCVERREAA
jgi:exosortase